MQKYLLLLGNVFLSSSVMAAGGGVDLPSTELNYLNCFNGTLFAAPPSNKNSKNYVADYNQILRSSKFKSLFNAKDHNVEAEGGDAPNSVTLIPKKQVNLLGLPISKIDVSTFTWDGGGMTLTLTTPKDFNATKQELTKKYGQLGAFKSSNFEHGFGKTQSFNVPNAYDKNEKQRYDHAISIASKGRSTEVTCQIMANYL